MLLINQSGLWPSWLDYGISEHNDRHSSPIYGTNPQSISQITKASYGLAIAVLRVTVYVKRKTQQCEL